MKIETKHNIGDKVFFIPEGQVIVAEVIAINIDITKDHQRRALFAESYLLNPSEVLGEIKRCEEGACFKTKKELLDYLLFQAV